MIAAGGLIWANVTPVRYEAGNGMPRYLQIDFDKLVERKYQPSWEVSEWGWPVAVVTRYTGDHRDEWRKRRLYEAWWLGVGIDLTVTASGLYVLWAVSEWWIRRRAARKRA